MNSKITVELPEAFYREVKAYVGAKGTTLKLFVLDSLGKNMAHDLPYHADVQKIMTRVRQKTGLKAASSVAHLKEIYKKMS